MEYTMPNAGENLDHDFLEMRCRCLSLAADLDRLERAAGGPQLLESDPRLQALRNAFNILLEARGNRAEQMQLLFSDRTSPPAR
jgi:uncharacterized membrane protein YccC